LGIRRHAQRRAACVTQPARQRAHLHRPRRSDRRERQPQHRQRERLRAARLELGRLQHRAVGRQAKVGAAVNRYGDDLAYIHHAGFSEFAKSAAAGVIELLAKHGVHSVIEIGCGSGVLARALTSAGFDVLGFDPSPAMIAIARETAPDARFEVASLETARMPPCDAIVAMGEVLNYGDLRAFVPRAAAALRRGGVLLFDIAERGSYPEHDEVRVGGEEWSVIAIKDSDGRTLTRRVLTFREVDGETRRDEEVHVLELYDRAEVLELLREFRVRVRRSYGRRRLPKGHAVYFGVRRP
jgi:SAM-dependent methyltransferase